MAIFRTIISVLAVVDVALGAAPTPAEPAMAGITLAPLIEDVPVIYQGLVKRNEGGPICGYVDGNNQAPVRCNSQEECRTSEKWVYCAPTSVSIKPKSSCSQSASFKTSGGSTYLAGESTPGVVYCGTTAPFCGTLDWGKGTSGVFCFPISPYTAQVLESPTASFSDKYKYAPTTTYGVKGTNAAAPVKAAGKAAAIGAGIGIAVQAAFL